MSVYSEDEEYFKTVAAQQGLGDEHVQSHVHELTERDDHVTIYQVGGAELPGHYNDRHLTDENADIGKDMQGAYETSVTPPEEVRTINGVSKEGGSIEGSKTQPLPMDTEV